jgi:hypothetical protein
MDEMEPTPSAGLLDEVRGFLSDLKRDWPEIFAARPRLPVRLPNELNGSGTSSPYGSVVPAKLVRAPKPGTEAAFFHGRAAHWAPLMGVTFGRVTVRDQRTRWASCSREGNLSFNWRLTLTPPETLDYVVVHELAHRLEMNHSRRFWAHVEKQFPDHRLHRRWLRKNGEALYRAKRPAP